MKFVWVTTEAPWNPENGPNIYAEALIRGLLETGATGTLIAYERRRAANVIVPGLDQTLLPLSGRNRIWSLFSPLQSDAWRRRSAQFEHALRRALQSGPDVLIIDYFAMGWTLDVAEKTIAAGTRRPLLVYISHNYESGVRFQVARSVGNPLMRPIVYIDAYKAAKLEKRLMDACDLITVHTGEDRACYEADVPGKPIIILTPGYDGQIAPTEPLNATRPRRVIILGSFEWIAKRTNLTRFLRAAKDPFEAAGIEVLVVGVAPEDFIRSVSLRYPFCKFTGWVDNVLPYLSSGRLGLMADYVGGGFKHKYLYYIFNGLPVATYRSEVVGLPVIPERDMIARNTPEELVHAIVDCIDDIQMLDGMRQRCWESCASAFLWSDRAELLRKTLDSLIAERRALQAEIA